VNNSKKHAEMHAITSDSFESSK